MSRCIFLFIAAILCKVTLVGALFAGGPWETNIPIVQVNRELYASYYMDDTDPENVRYYTPVRWPNYVGPDLQMTEYKAWMGESDTPEDDQERYSLDNGQTWTDWVDIPAKVTWDGDTRIFWGPVAETYDPSAGKTVAVWIRQTKLHNTTYYNHSFLRTSDDYGRTWNDPQLLMYESGADFNPADPYNLDFLENNAAYVGPNIVVRQDGSLLFGVTSANIPDEVPQSEFNPYDIKAFAPADARGIGAVDFIVDWNSASGEYDVSASNVAWVPRHVSSRGLIEATTAELTDGRLLTVYRDSNAKITGYADGHKQYALSTDGGDTISQPLELKYDDGTSFYSPSSISHLIRHSITGKLYWVGNINLLPADGNSDRYPLVIAEVDEVNVALKKDTVTLIDDRQATDGETLQLSNFSLLEDHQTHQFKMVLARLGEDSSDIWKANSYEYTLSLMPNRPDDTLPKPVAAGGTIPYAWYRTDVPGTVKTWIGSDQVAWLQDQTGSRHLAAVGDPQLTDSGVDGQACISFTGQDDQLLGSPDEWGEAAPGTIFVVYRRSGESALGRTFLYDSAAEQRQFFAINDGFYPEDKLEVGGAVYTDGVWEAHTTGLGAVDDPVGADQWAVASVSYVTGVDDTVRINGQEVFSGNLLSGGMTGLRLGGFFLDQKKHWTGDIGEFVIFEGELSPEEIATIELILMNRWGLIAMGPGDTNNDGVVDAA
ncbi:MAG: hypothetical protein JW818_07970, partial [Pirellulales bacterium]|nr:hypothetical protein [Pirellulales bacterium]